jgi:hypothetical protein
VTFGLTALLKMKKGVQDNPTGTREKKEAYVTITSAEGGVTPLLIVVYL